MRGHGSGVLPTGIRRSALLALCPLAVPAVTPTQPTESDWRPAILVCRIHEQLSSERGKLTAGCNITL